MSSFQVISELGLARRMRTEKLPPTPWLLETGNGLTISGTEVTFSQFSLSEKGCIPLVPIGMRQNTGIVPDSVTEITNYSFLLPKLLPASRDLDESLVFELKLFLDRLDQYVLPPVFGIMYDPINFPDFYLEEILTYKPSIIALKLKSIDHISSGKMVNLIMDLKTKLPMTTALYLAGGCPIGYQTVMVALGVDIFDDASAYRFAGKNQIFEDGFIKKVKKDYNFTYRINLNKEALKQDFKHIISSIDSNSFWTRFAREMHTTPQVASYYNYISREVIPNYLGRFPVNNVNLLKFTGDEGLYHPDVLKFQEQLLKTYTLHKSKKVIILLPCSAKKPYRESRSHRVFVKSIKNALGRNFFKAQIISLTSPLGAVPRELETVYPAQFYDIPVSGNWSEEESRLTGNVLSKLLKKIYVDQPIIAHVSRGYKQMIEIASRSVPIDVSWEDSFSTSKEAMTQLEEKLRQISDYLDQAVPSDKKIVRVKQIAKSDQLEINTILAYNHGFDVNLDYAESIKRGHLPKPIHIYKNNKIWLTWDKLKGIIKLSIDSALEIAQESKKWILMDTVNLQGSTVYAVGLKQASEDISPNDEILIFDSDKSKLLGVGIATISGKTMNVLQTGPIAKIRKKNKLQIELSP
ncbi:MAG: DUF5591 domain-containing protein [Candidatus Heimdallarchaeota archaeon]|nr:DUF5591 domain-containing protein [Candidatus Heimdallarchaeota archaeon]